ncbi:4Fe-4S double cluster binding domain-containing protein [Methanobacterium alcaliphilum]|uniref:4Fe-4S double cluster binding domain-containing protein n=1 Tax=Methanobacterium alcaliphilum TaxID=392018 RepID=UPI00200B0824|nr:4Fe-4S double cluster binding domain-containing protein [Methanobacterium alcaliphilum]MCK9152560.1 4Fe-4S dicluster domain-containing protein [Methanobacterium alcaliphilum]
MNLYEEIKEIAEGDGVEFIGVADLSPAKSFIQEYAQHLLDEYPKAITLGIRLLDDVVDQLPNRKERFAAVNYMNTYEVTNQRLDLLSYKISDLLQKKGFKVLPIPASERCDDEKIAAVFSHKLAAHLAGIGWIGKSCLLISPEAGPRARWITVLTNAPLDSTGTPMENSCGDCNRCVDICPVNAFSGKEFNAKEPREVRYDAYKCEKYFEELESAGQMPVCGLCINVCPHGKKGK